VPTPTEQAWPSVGNVSSDEPSQLSSRPLHTSVPGVPGATEHVVPVCAVLQTWLPWRVHVPTPTLHA